MRVTLVSTTDGILEEPEETPRIMPITDDTILVGSKPG